MATLGNVPAEAYTNTVKDSFSGNGSTTAFTMSLPTVTNDVRVVVENVIQDPTVAYSVSGTTLTFTSAPPSGTNNVYVVHLGPAVMTTVPPAEIADATTFASSLTVQGAFTSQGIDDNGNATALTIDSSENVLVGTTTANPTSSAVNTAGQEFSTTGGVRSTVTSNAAATFNRKTDDGAVVLLRKNGTTVGSIGVAGSELFIGSTSGTDSYLGFGADLLKPVTSTGAGRSGAISLGNANARFKDLYLSGGIHLGGTGAANKLEDYEEGTFTPSVSVGSASTASGVYTKVGRLVTIQCRVNGWSNTSNNEVQLITNLPFTIVETSRAVGSAMWDAVDTDNSYGVVYAVSGNSLAFYSASRNGGFDSIRCIDMDNSGTTVHFFATYMAT